jgi:hypothetical protein
VVHCYCKNASQCNQNNCCCSVFFHGFLLGTTVMESGKYWIRYNVYCTIYLYLSQN